MLEDIDPSLAFWYMALARASPAFMQAIKTGDRMKALSSLLPKFNKRYHSFSDSPCVSFLPIDDDTEDEAVVSAGAEITAQCSELLKLNLEQTTQDQVKPDEDPLTSPIPRRVTKSKSTSDPDPDDITIEPSIATTGGADSNLAIRLAILFVTSSQSSSGDEVLHAPELSDDLAVRLVSRAVPCTFSSHLSHIPRLSFGTVPRKSMRQLRSRSGILLSTPCSEMVSRSWRNRRKTPPRSSK